MAQIHATSTGSTCLPCPDSSSPAEHSSSAGIPAVNMAMPMAASQIQDPQYAGTQQHAGTYYMYYNPPPALPANPIHRSTLPVPGLTSGMLPSGMNYPILPQLCPLGLEAPPSPLQQWISVSGYGGHGGAGAEAAGLKVGVAVKLCNLHAKGMDRYNGLVGDITLVHGAAEGDSEEMLFDIRCPLSPPMGRMMVGSEMANLQPSQKSLQACEQNRVRLAPLYNLSEDQARRSADDPRLPPFVALVRLPTEKFELL
eukprot:TRINITY_DN89280_c0_g1_i1.p1 TRINITY_DN89280_c0_g1~~TRINITY_DN89280_c0_g1_i1.p1  ORF type:complete len:255 (+),score=38.32 TRINITY_DN89280_c0_g1_i1:2-766(+)